MAALTRIRVRRRPSAILGLAIFAVALLVPTGAHAGFPGANGKIVFASYDGASHIYTISPSGKNLTHIHHPGADPAWSPDGRMIAFTDRAPDSETAVFTVRADGSGVRRVTPKGLEAYEPAWSPGGKQLVFTVADSALNEALYITGLPGKKVTKLTDLPGYEFQPSWSPDGERIAFVMADLASLSFDIYTIRPDGTDLRRLTTTPLEAKFSPSWSPDGESLVFEGFAIGSTQADLFVIGADGTGQRQITDTPWQEQWPSFSPDGKRLLFGSDKDGDWDIYTLGVDGSVLRKLTHNLSDERVADWQAVEIGMSRRRSRDNLPLARAAYGNGAVLLPPLPYATPCTLQHCSVKNITDAGSRSLYESAMNPAPLPGSRKLPIAAIRAHSRDAAARCRCESVRRS